MARSLFKLSPYRTGKVFHRAEVDFSRKLWYSKKSCYYVTCPYRHAEKEIPMKRALSLILALALVLALAPATALAVSDAYGNEIWLQDTAIHQGVTLSDNVYWSTYYSQLRHEYYITYTPGQQVVPVVAYGESVCDRLTASTAVKNYEAMGYRVVGSINGDFYDTATGYPLGLLVSGGEILSGSANYYAVGFRADGSAVMGSPKLQITLTSRGQTLSLAAINKPRVENGGVTMLTYDFRSDHTTGTTTAGVSVLATVLTGSAAIGGEMMLRVDQVVEDTSAISIGENQVVLTTSLTGYTQGLSMLRAMMPGETFTVSFTADPQWMGVTEAIGGLYLLVDNGVAQSGFSAGNAPRTAIGLKATGEVVLYTVDGRQSDYSMGSSLNVLAQRMAELGCVTAICLDGGGSTTITASTPDSTVTKLINSPSDGSQRKVSNHLFLLASGMPTGIPNSVYLSASAPVVLAGHTVELTANLVDSAYFPMSEPVMLTASSGQIDGNTFIAPAQGGTVTITATSSTGLTASVDILVIDSPDSMTVQRGGSNISALTLTPGATAELSVSVIYNHMELETTPSDFIWSVDPSLGTIDQNGVLQVGFTEGKGNITVTKGSSTVTIPLTIDGKSPFVDTEGHWGVTYLTTLYYQGILTGVTVDGKLYAYPDRGVTREEFAVLLSRYMGINTADYASVEVPFADMDQVDSWAADAVRAMYALGIVGGSTVNGQQVFNPDGTLTRAEAVTMLGRMRTYEGVTPADLSAFSDAASVPAYAVEHFQTMVALGVIGGSDGKLDPNGTMTRAAVCKVLATMP